MNYVIAVFKSRHATLNFANLLRSHHIPVAIINTPGKIAKTCGISVKFLSDYFDFARNMLRAVDARYFDGFYAFNSNRGILTRI